LGFLSLSLSRFYPSRQQVGLFQGALDALAMHTVAFTSATGGTCALDVDDPAAVRRPIYDGLIEFVG
jgi:hypothetical protein